MFSQHPAWVYHAGKLIEKVLYCLNINFIFCEVHDRSGTLCRTLSELLMTFVFFNITNHYLLPSSYKLLLIIIALWRTRYFVPRWDISLLVRPGGGIKCHRGGVNISSFTQPVKEALDNLTPWLCFLEDSEIGYVISDHMDSL